ncbi:MAG TPA: zinc-ribbon domain-containing protein [Polyangia bacterium]|nr:zinc-ribbon domain-containing protein [Polyangia bacterium]
MIIKCPQCSTGYNVPDEAITGKPRKMRCSRCAQVFTLHRRAEVAPAGYEEFTGRQNLPTEFAFLREAAAEARPPLAEPIPPDAQASVPAPVQAPAPPQTGLYRRLIEQDGDAGETIPLDPPMVFGPTAPAAPAIPLAEPRPEPGPAVAVTEPRPTPAGVSDIYNSSRSAWEMEAPLELGGFAIPDESVSSSGAQTAGKIVVVGLILFTVFFLFVAFRNGWSLSLEELSDQISFAFSGAEHEPIPDAARDIELQISERHLVQADSGGHYLVVSGTAFNSAIYSRREVIVRGRLVDSNGEIRGETRAPCGKVLEDETIRVTAPEAIEGHYRQGGVFHICRIKADDTGVFQLIFADVPADYGSTFTVEVKAVAAAVGD